MITRQDILNKMEIIECQITDIEENLEYLTNQGSDVTDNQYFYKNHLLKDLKKQLKTYEDIADELRCYTAYDESEFEDHARGQFNECLDQLRDDDTYSVIINHLEPDYKSYAHELSHDYTVIKIDDEEYYLV